MVSRVCLRMLGFIALVLLPVAATSQNADISIQADQVTAHVSPHVLWVDD